MEPGVTMKVPIVEQGKTATGVRDRPFLAMACAVGTLAVAFIVLIACGTYALRQDCPATTDMAMPKEQKRTTTERDIPVKKNGTTFNEHTTIYVEDEMEFVVSRDSKTGMVANVITIDYQKEVTTVYDASMHMCFMARGLQNSFEQDKNFLDNYKDGDAPASGRNIYIDFDNAVDNPDDIPVQMAPFCTTKNSMWVVEKPEDEVQRHKRNTWLCIAYNVCFPDGTCWNFYWYSSSASCPPHCFHCCFVWNSVGLIFYVNGQYCFYNTPYCSTSHC